MQSRNRMEAATGPPAYPKSLRLLSLDGGGVRGLSELLILKRLMHRIQPETKGQKLGKPCDYFDVICGTSTGGLIAIMLGRLEMTVDDCIQAYVKLSKEIFPKESVGKTGWLASATKLVSAYREKAWFSAEALEKCLKETIAERLGAEEVSQQFLTQDSQCKVLVCVTRAANAGAALLRAYESQFEPPIACSIWEAARATSAAPLYFDPISIGPLGAIYADGGMKNNNPVWALFNEVRNEWPNFEIACLVSIGAGKPETKPLGTGLQEVMESCVAIASETEDTARLFRTAHKDLQGRYFRFNVEQGLQGIGLDEWMYFDRMDAATHDYLTDLTDELGSCAAKLAILGQNQSPFIR